MSRPNSQSSRPPARRSGGNRPPASSQQRRTTTDPARRAAYDVLHQVGASDGYANLVAREIFADRRLDTRDAAFATELVMGVLRRQGTLDAVLAACVDRPLAKLDPRVLDVLRLGAYQLLFMQTASHAAVHSSVDLVGDVCGNSPRGLVNAVLRKVSGKDADQWLATLSAQAADPLAQLAVTYSHPRWIISALRDALGSDRDELVALLERNNTAPVVTLAARPGRSTVEELAAGPGAEPGLWSPYAVRLPGGRPSDVDAVREQRAAVQDEGSQLATLALTGAPMSDGQPPESAWLDMCAGPGGKAGLMAALAAAEGAALLAVEPRPARARLVRRALRASPGDHLVVQADGRSGPWRLATFDRVLVDAPCTGIGVLRRRPESRWRRQPKDVAALADLQRALLHSAVDATATGGLIAYVTCSPHIAETDLVVDDVLGTRRDIMEIDARAGLPSAAAAAVNDASGLRVRLWPHRHDTDGMFVALLRKR